MANKIKIKNIDLSYIAGIIDGEGCISLTKVFDKRKLNKGHAYYRFFPSVQITMLDLEPLKFIYDRFDCYYKHEKYHYVLFVGYDKVTKFLELIFPYLTNKKIQAKLVLKYINIRKHKKAINKSWGGANNKNIGKEEEKIYIKLKKLHMKKGKGWGGNYR